MLGEQFNKIKFCREDWNKMEQQACGRLCASCNKTIYDFRGKTPHQILLKQADHGGLACGVYDADFFDQFKPLKYRSKRFSFSAIWFYLIGLFPMSGIAQKQSPPLVEKTEQSPVSSELKPLPSADKKKEIIKQQFIRGIVIDQESQRPIPFALVQVLGTDLHAYTDIDGKFELSLFLTESEDKSRTVRITNLGYVQIERDMLAVDHTLKRIPVIEMRINTEIVFSVKVGDYDPTPARKTGIWPQFNTFYLSKKRIWQSEPDRQ